MEPRGIGYLGLGGLVVRVGIDRCPESSQIPAYSQRGGAAIDRTRLVYRAIESANQLEPAIRNQNSRGIATANALVLGTRTSRAAAKAIFR